MTRVLIVVLFCLISVVVFSAGENLLDKTNQNLNQVAANENMRAMLEGQSAKDIQKLVENNINTNTKGSVLSPAQISLNEINQCSNVQELQSLMKPGRMPSDKCYIPPGRSSCAPQFIIPGSMKCGTTSLYTYLQDHPQVLPLATPDESHNKVALANKEIRFLDNADATAKRYESIEDLYDVYYNYFKVMPYDKDFQLFSGDATPMYVCKENVAKKAYYANPNAKIIIMVREPVDRMWSETWFLDSLKPSPANPNDIEGIFEECVRAELARVHYCANYFSSGLTIENASKYFSCYTNVAKDSASNKCEKPEYYGMCSTRRCAQGTVKNSFYASQIIEWKEFFGDNLMVINSNDFYGNPAHYMEIIGDFIGLEPYDWSSVTSHAFNIVNPKVNKNTEVITNSPGLGIGVSDHGNEYPVLREDLRREFEEAFVELNELLYRLLDKPNFWEY